MKIRADTVRTCAVRVIFVWVLHSDFWCGARCASIAPRKSVVYACVGGPSVCVCFVCRTCWTLLMQAGGTGTRPQIDSVEACRNGKRGRCLQHALITVLKTKCSTVYMCVDVCVCALFSTLHCCEPTLFSVGLSFTRETKSLIILDGNVFKI